MAHWNYRVVQRTYPNGEVLMAIHEAHYENGEEHPGSITVDPVVFVGNTPDEIEKALKKALEATTKPVLVWESYCKETDAG